MAESMSIRDRIYGGGKKKRKPCPSAEAIDRDILRGIVEDTAEVCEDTTANEAYCVEEVDLPPVPPMPQEEGRAIRVKVAPRRTPYGEPCSDSDEQTTLENWDIHGIRIVGNIYNDRSGRYRNGELMFTSTVQDGGSELVEGSTLRTRNATYLLGKRKIPNDE